MFNTKTGLLEKQIIWIIPQNRDQIFRTINKKNEEHVQTQALNKMQNCRVNKQTDEIFCKWPWPIWSYCCTQFQIDSRRSIWKFSVAIALPSIKNGTTRHLYYPIINSQPISIYNKKSRLYATFQKMMENDKIILKKNVERIIILHYKPIVFLIHQWCP